MSIIVYPMNKSFIIHLELRDKSKFEFEFNQLSYARKSEITGKTTDVKQGKVIIDSTLQCFLTLKHGLKRIKGFKMEDGKEYALEFEEDGSVKDECLDIILNTPVTDTVIYAARDIMDGIPTEILHPVTQEPLPGVSVSIPKAMRPKVEKKK